MALEASCGWLVNWQHHDFLAAFQKGKCLPFDLADAGESRGSVLAISITGVLRYIERFKPLTLPLRYVFIGCSDSLRT